jgi:hypothetical protein
MKMVPLSVAATVMQNGPRLVKRFAIAAAVRLSFAAVCLLWGCATSPDWASFDEGVENADAIYLCDAVVNSNRIHFLVKQVWRKEPDILAAFDRGANLSLPELEAFRDARDTEGPQLEVFWFITDLKKYASEDNPLPVSPDGGSLGRYACYGVWTYSGSVRTAMAIKRIQKTLQPMAEGG